MYMSHSLFLISLSLSFPVFILIVAAYQKQNLFVSSSLPKGSLRKNRACTDAHFAGHNNAKLAKMDIKYLYVESLISIIRY